MSLRRRRKKLGRREISHHPLHPSPAGVQLLLHADFLWFLVWWSSHSTYQAQAAMATMAYPSVIEGTSIERTNAFLCTSYVRRVVRHVTVLPYELPIQPDKAEHGTKYAFTLSGVPGFPALTEHDDEVYGARRFSPAVLRKVCLY